MDIFGYLFGTLCAVAVAVLVGIPDRWFAAQSAPTDPNSPDNWGNPGGTEECQSQSGKHIVVCVRPRKHKTIEKQVPDGNFVKV